MYTILVYICILVHTYTSLLVHIACVLERKSYIVLLTFSYKSICSIVHVYLKGKSFVTSVIKRYSRLIIFIFAVINMNSLQITLM